MFRNSKRPDNKDVVILKKPKLRESTENDKASGGPASVKNEKTNNDKNDNNMNVQREDK